MNNDMIFFLLTSLEAAPRCSRIRELNSLVFVLGNELTYLQSASMFRVCVLNHRDAPDCSNHGETSVQAEPELRRLGAQRETGNGRFCPCLPLPAPSEFSRTCGGPVTDAGTSVVLAAAKNHPFNLWGGENINIKFCTFCRKPTRNWL